jgi:hypothetical protein
MSLRDYFAGQALIGYLLGRNEPNANAADFKRRKTASQCYEYADAMLDERERTGGHQ